MRFWFGVFFLLCSFFTAHARQNIKVIDGDSLFINNREIRLSGIDAPEYRQICYDSDGAEYFCGKEALKMLKNMIDDTLICKPKVVDRYGREVADCFVGDKNINKEMVRLGYAVAYDRYTKDYVAAQKEAKKHKRGIWSGRFMKPELYRRLVNE